MNLTSYVTNQSSMIVQNNLNKSTRALNTAIERMTTGYKINGAKDNAANYSIVQNMSNKITSYQVAEENAQMGMDMVQTATENLDLVNSHLSRIRNLTEQAANGTYGEQSLQAIQSEIDARIAEINRIVAGTEYNGIKLFEGVTDSSGANVTGYFLAEVDQMSEEYARSHGNYTIIKTADELYEFMSTAADASRCVLMNDIDLAGYDWDGASINFYSKTLNGNGHVIKNYTGSDAFVRYASQATFMNVGFENVNISSTSSSVTGLIGSVSNHLAINNVYITGNISDSSSGGYITPIGPYQDHDFHNVYVDAYLSADIICLQGYINFSDSNVYYNSDKIRGNISATTYTGLTTAELRALIRPPSHISGGTITNFQIGINGDESSQISINTGFGFDLSVDVTSHDSAISALSTIDAQMHAVSEKQTQMGAVQNRLESVLDSISTAYENLVSSRSTLQDADIAEVSSDYIRQQILQQAAATLLATANQSPSIALQLI